MAFGKENGQVKRRLPNALIMALFAVSAVTLSLLAVDCAILRHAGRLYEAGRYDAALRRYSSTLIRYLHPDVFSLNAGAALYKKEEYQKAGEFFGERLAYGDAPLAAPLHYNIGNSRYRQGRQSEKVNPEMAASLYREALACYQKSLRLNPADPDALYNMALTEAKLKAIADQAVKKEGEGQADRKREGGGESPKNRPAGDLHDRGSELQSPDSASAENIRLSGENKKGADRRAAPGQLKVKKGEMSRKDAEMLLEEYRQMEEHQGRPGGKALPGIHSEVAKDW
jgi:tetratricopeptide (TPR) repeat protein